MGPEDHPWAVAISFFMGWTYFLLWSASFYPQPIHNWRRRSTSGLSIDFPFCNVLGMTCYTLSTGLLLFNPVVRQQYAKDHPRDPIPTVAINDFIFALHGAICCCITLSQFLPGLWPFERQKPVPRPSIPMMVVCGTIVLAILYACYCVGTPMPSFTTAPPESLWHWNWANVVGILATAKVLLTMIKYVPQVLLNWRNRSTVGFKIDAVLMDVVGSVLSLGQLFVDAAIIQGGDWSSVTNNPGKFGLGNVSLLFNIIFMWQHYVAYRGQEPISKSRVAVEDRVDDARPAVDEQTPLLSGNGQATA